MQTNMTRLTFRTSSVVKEKKKSEKRGSDRTRGRFGELDDAEDDEEEDSDDQDDDDDDLEGFIVKGGDDDDDDEGRTMRTISPSTLRRAIRMKRAMMTPPTPILISLLPTRKLSR